MLLDIMNWLQMVESGVTGTEPEMVSAQGWSQRQLKVGFILA